METTQKEAKEAARKIKRESTSIVAAFNIYWEAVYAPVVPTKFAASLKRQIEASFYGGAGSLLAMLASNSSSDELGDIVKGWSNEIHEYANKMSDGSMPSSQSE